VLASGTEAGGAERSLLEHLLPGSAHFLLPGAGGLAGVVAERGHTWEEFRLPTAWRRLTQRGFSGRFDRILQVPALLFPLPAQIRLLRRRLETWDGEVISLGVKSHLRCLFVASRLGPRLIFDVRDFIRPRLFRPILAWIARRHKNRIRVNSRAVRRDYPGAEVVYPQVRLPRPVAPRPAPGPPWIVTHAGFFAPYKGQDLFLELGATLLEGGLDARFWLIGDAAYPAPEYLAFAEKLRARAARDDLRGRVRFAGRVEEIQGLLEQTHLLLHCTREPEPFGRVILEALQCGCEVICHGGSGACELLQTSREFPDWMAPLGRVLPGEFVRVTSPLAPLHA